MKRALFLLSAIVLLVGCTKTNEFDPKPNYGGEEANPLTSIYAGFADEDSRTYVENDTDILWQNGDALSLFYANYSNVKFVYNGESGARMAKFDIVNNSGSTNDLNNFKTHALYPYNANATTKYDETTKSFNISTVFPTTQSYAPNSFGCGANVMVAASDDNVSENEMLHFRNACGYFTVKLYGEGVKVRTIKLTARNSERIAGAATIKTHAENAPEVTVSLDGSSHVVLDCGEEGVALGADKENATEFWFALPPVALNNGVHIEVTATDGTVFKKETTNKIVIERNKIQPMAALKFVQSVPNNNVLWYTRHDNPTTPFEWDEDDNEDMFDATITKHYYDSANKRIVVEFATPLTTIKYEAFMGYAGNIYKDLKTMTLPNSLTTIEEGAFRNTGIVEFVIPGSVTYIGEDAFLFCYDLESVIIEPSPTNQPLSIEYDQVFGSAPLKYINVNRDFRFMSGDEEVDLDSSGGGLFAFAGDVNPTKIVLGEQLSKIYGYMFAGVPMTEFEIPKHITEIGMGAFSYCENLTEITIPATIKSIGDDAFYKCIGLNTICFEDSDEPLIMGYSYESLSTAEWGPFYETPLKNIYMGRDIIQVDDDGDVSEADEWDDGLFVNTHYDEDDMILNVTIGPKVTRILNHMFNYMKIGSINIPEGVTSIGVEAFRSCEKLSSLTIPASMQTIEYDAFYDCTDLKELIVKDSDTPLTIGYTYTGVNGNYGPFYDSPLTNIYCGRNFTQVDKDGKPYAADYPAEGVFSNCGYDDETLTVSLTIGPKVTRIEYYMFSRLGIENVNLPASITSIGRYAFYMCEQLQRISCLNPVPPTLGTNALSECGKMSKIIVPSSAVSAYKSAAGWSAYASYISAQ